MGKRVYLAGKVSMNYCQHENREPVRFYMRDSRVMVRMQCTQCGHLHQNAVKQDQYDVESLPIAKVQTEDSSSNQMSMFG